jgi:Na+-translocating ferredoxin:NAD+ oxidoreductase RnfC subunit
MNKSDTTLRIDATFGLKVKSGDKIHKGQHINTNQEQAATSPISGTVKSIHFDPDNHELVIVISPSG